MVWYRYEYITDMNVRHQEEQGAASLTPAPITCLPTWLLGRVLDSLPYPLHRPDELVRALAGLRSTHRCFTHEIVEVRPAVPASTSACCLRARDAERTAGAHLG